MLFNTFKVAVVLLALPFAAVAADSSTSSSVSIQSDSKGNQTVSVNGVPATNFTSSSNVSVSVSNGQISVKTGGDSQKVLQDVNHAVNNALNNAQVNVNSTNGIQVQTTNKDGKSHITITWKGKVSEYDFDGSVSVSSSSTNNNGVEKATVTIKGDDFTKTLDL